MIQDVKRQLFLQLLLDAYSAPLPQLWTKLPLAKVEIPKIPLTCPPSQPLTSNLAFLMRVHYTWIARYLGLLPKQFHKPIASLFPDFGKILKTLGEETGKEAPQQGEVQPYLFHLLIEKMELKEKLPLCFLPSSPMGGIAHWSRSKTLSLIDILPLADAAREIKKVVSKSKLMLIDSSLSPMQRAYLKHILATKHTACELALNLPNWQGSKEQLQTYLHRIGLDLFYKALFKEHPDFLFYVSHILDIGRGKSLAAAAKAAELDEKNDLYYKNLAQCYNFINSYEKS